MSVFSTIRQWGGGIFHGTHQKDDDSNQNNRQEEKASRNGRRQKGISIQHTTVSYSPFHSLTRTVKVENPRKAVKPGEKRPLLDVKPTQGIPYSSSSVEWNIKRKSMPDDIVSKLSDPSFYHSLIAAPSKSNSAPDNAAVAPSKNQTLFPVGGMTDREILKSQLVVLQVRLNQISDAPAVPAAVAGAEMVVITQAVALATENHLDPCADAARGLACLQNLNLVDLIRNHADAQPPGEEAEFKCPAAGIGPGGHKNANFDNDDLDCAWRIALRLAETPVGFNALMKMTRKDLGETAHASLKKHDETMLRVYLKAGLEWAKRKNMLTPPPEQKPVGIGPKQMHEVVQVDNAVRGRDASQSPPAGYTGLLDKGLEAIHEHLCHSHAHATDENVASTPFNPAHDRFRATHEWAIGAIRNGVYTDAKEENGKSTLFHRMEHRLKKMDIWIDRVNDALDKGPDATGNKNKKTIGEKVEDFMIQLQPWKKKSAFYAYENTRSRDEKGVSAIFANADISGIGDGRAFREDLMLTLATALKARGGPQVEDWDEGVDEYKGEAPPPVARRDTELFYTAEDGKQYIALGDPRAPDMRSLRSAVRLAILEQRRADYEFMLPRYLDGEPLDNESLEKAEARLGNYIQGGFENLPNSAKGQIKSLLHATNAQLTVEKMVEWAADVGGPANVEQAVAQARLNHMARKAAKAAQPAGGTTGQAPAATPEAREERAMRHPAFPGYLTHHLAAAFRESVSYYQRAEGKHYVKGVGTPENPNKEALKRAVQLAIMEQASADELLTRRSGDESKKFDKTARKLAYARLKNHIDFDFKDLKWSKRREINKMLKEYSREITMKGLRDWATAVCGEEVHMQAEAQAVLDVKRQLGESDPADGASKWRAFNLAVDRLVNGRIIRTATPSIRNMTTKDELGIVFENHINRQELGSGATMIGGGAAGAGLRGMTGTTIGSITKYLVRPIAALGLTNGRSAVMSVGLGPEGDELFLGRQKTKRVEVGAGLALLQPIPDNFGAGVGGEITYSREKAEKTGVTIRFPRMDDGMVWHDGKVGLELDPENSAKLGRLTRKLINNGKATMREGHEYHYAPEEDGESKLKNLWQEFPEASVNWAGPTTEKGQSQITNAFKKQADVFAGVAIGELRLGAGIGGNRISKWGKEKDWGETGGSVQVSRLRNFATKEGNVYGSPGVIGAVFPISANPGGGIPAGDMNFAQGVPGAAVAGLNFNVSREGAINDVILVEQDGALKKDTYFQTAYLNAKQFVDAVEERTDDWAETKARKFDKVRRDIHGEKELVPTGTFEEQVEQIQKNLRSKENSVRTERKKILEYMQYSLDNPTPTTSFLVYNEIKDEVIPVADALKAVATHANALGRPKYAAQCMSHREKLLRSETSYDPGYLVDIQFEMKKADTGLDYGAIATRSDTIVTTNLRGFN